MTQFTFIFIQITPAVIDDLSHANRKAGCNVHFDIPIPSGSCLMDVKYGTLQDLEELMGETDTNRTKKSVSIVTQTDLGSLANVMECISNGAARAQVYVEIHGNTVPIHIQCSTLIMSALRHSETRRWFKLHDLEQPWVKFTVITLLSHIMVTLNKAARLPHNQQALLAGTPERYTKGPLQDCLTAVRSWEGRIQACVTGGEQIGMTKIYMSTYLQHSNLSPTHGASFIPSQIRQASGHQSRNTFPRTLTRGQTTPLRHPPQNASSRTRPEQTPSTTQAPRVTSFIPGRSLSALVRLSLHGTSSLACPAPATAKSARP